MRWLCGFLAVCIMAWTEFGVAHAQLAECGPGLVCPANTKCTSAGKCIPADAVECSDGKYCPRGQFCIREGACLRPTIAAKDGCLPNEERTSARGCMPKGYVDCGNGRYCNPGTRCNPNGTACLGGPPATGPQCGASRCSANELCMPHGRSCYDPAVHKVCPGGHLCNVALECTQTACQSPGPKSAQREGRPPIRATASPKRGNPEACAHMATSIARAKAAIRTIEARRYHSNPDTQLELCRLVDSRMDELVNVSGADCPQRLPEVRSFIGALAADKCDEHRKAKLSQCQGNAVTYSWRDAQGQQHVNQCSNPGGVRG